MANGIAGPTVDVPSPGFIPWLGTKIRSAITAAPELTLIVFFVIAAYIAMGVFSKVEGTEVLSSTSIWMVLSVSFILSTAIAVFAVMAGIGGGIIFTPVMLGFTSIDSLVIRSTGLVVAMFSGLISTGPFMRKGLSNIRLVVYGAVPVCLGATIGALGAIAMKESMAEKGDALVNLMLGLIIAFACFVFIKGGAKYEFPEAKHEDKLGKKLGFSFSYWEESLGKEISWRNQRVLMGGLLLLGVGVIGGFFGLGGGWALTPILNMVMATPLKVAAASSGVLLAMSDGTAAWQYIKYGSLIPVFAAPWLLGQVVGGAIGAQLLAKARVTLIRYFVITVLALAGTKLLIKAVEQLAGIDIPIL
ncbi:sulfite exporter TauE/SafE family protein [Chloroflexota bacterium]